MAKRWKWIAVLAGVVATAVAVGVFALGHDEPHPRFVASALVANVTYEQCLNLGMTEYGFGQDLAEQRCEDARDGIWFDVTVRNVGDQEGFLMTCAVEGLDELAHGVLKARMSFYPIQWPPGPPVNSGETRTLRWYGLVVDPATSNEGSVASYKISCPAVEYDGPVPV